MSRRVYIAGPMTDLEDLNFPAFHVAAQQLRDRGLVVENPAEINPDPNASWQHCMRQDIARLVACDVVAFLPGWERSRGATLEAHIALELGIEVTSVDVLLARTRLP